MASSSLCVLALSCPQRRRFCGSSRSSSARVRARRTSPSPGWPSPYSHEGGQRLIHGLHLVDRPPTVSISSFSVVQVTVEDQLGHLRRCAGESLRPRPYPRPPRRWEPAASRHDCPPGPGRELLAHLMVTRLGDMSADDPVHGLGRRCWCASVEKTRCPVSAAVEHGVDRLLVPHLADHDHVRVLPQDVSQSHARSSACRCRSRAGSPRTALSVDQELDRVLDRDDVDLPGLGDLPQHRRQRRRLAGARRPRDQHQPL